MKKILVLTDFSTRAEHAAELAVRIAERTNSKLIFYHAFFVPELVPSLPGAYPYFEDYTIYQKENLASLQKFAEELVNKIHQKEPDFVIPEFELINEAGSAGLNIRNLLRHKRNIWMILMGQKTHKDDGIEHLFFGSDINDAISRSTVPVLLVPEKIKLKYIKHVAYATDLSKTDHKALHMLAELASFFDAKITVVHVTPQKLSVNEKLKNVDLFNHLKAKIGYANISYEDVIGDDVPYTLSKFGKAEKLEILAMSHRKHPLLERLLHESTTREVLEYHNISLLIFPPDFK